MAIVALPVAARYLQVDPLLDEAHCLSDQIVSFCRRKSIRPVARGPWPVERTSQLTMVPELVSLSHGVSMISAMVRRRDESGRRVYRSLSDPKPTRTIAVVWNPHRFQIRLLKAFRESLRQAGIGIGGATIR